MPKSVRKSRPGALRIAITGASRGLGLGLAKFFAESGHSVWGCARGEAPEFFEHPKCHYQRLDMTKSEALAGWLESIFESADGIDVLINNAGIIEPMGWLRTLDAPAILEQLHINVGALMIATGIYLKKCHSKKASASDFGGRVINISSGAAAGAYQGWAVYCASKAAVNQFSEVVDAEERAHGHRVFALAPGVVDTDMQAQIRDQDAEAFAVVKRCQQFKAEDYQTSEQVGRAVQWLVESDGLDRVCYDVRSMFE